MANQGFNVTVGGQDPATVVISRLLDANRQLIGDPTNISGTIYVQLDVQPNEETVTDIALTLNGEAVTPLCRGTGGDAAADIPGLAETGSQIEVECQLRTNAPATNVCEGLQIDPKYANGDYDLSAYLMTTKGDKREAFAGQSISLNNHGYVKIAHSPGSASEVGAHTDGLTFYGGPAADDNVNMFHACPVAYDGTIVGKMRLSTRLTDTDQQALDGTTVVFRESRFADDYPYKEAPFTWSAGTQWWSPNNSVENVPGETETWIVNDGQILNPDGGDITGTFRAGGMDDTAKFGPLHFDFKAPTVADNSEVVIAAHGAAAADWVSTTAIYYRDSGGNSARRFRITEMSDLGVGHVYGETSEIAVGDYSAGKNNDADPNTAFVPVEGLENVTHIHQLPEEDPIVNGIADGGGVDTYVAELQSLADRLGNSTWLGDGTSRIRTATHFGVDRTPPVISRVRPSESLVLKTDELYFEIEDPRLETGEDGSQPRATVHAYAGDSRYWVTSRHYWTASPAPETAGGSVTVNIAPAGNARFAREETHVVYVRALDVAGNATSTSFTFVRDQTDPALSLSAVPSSFGATTAKSVNVTVAGTLSDATEIRRAFLSIHAGDTCAEGDDALASTQVSGPVRRLDNGTNKIEFSEVFTVKQGDDAGLTSYCFYLKAEDDARDADDRAAANIYSAMVSTFEVGWPAGDPPPPPGPTFEFSTRTDDTDPSTATAATMVEATEGTATTTYWVSLNDEAPTPTATAPVNVSVNAAPGLSVAPQTFDFWDETLGTPAPIDSVQVTITTTQDLDIVSNVDALTHSATGFDDASLMVTSTDDDFEITVDVDEIREDAAAQEVTVTVTAGTAPTTETTVSVDLGYPTNDAETTPAAPTSVSVVIDADATSGEAKVNVDALNDAVRDEVNESIALTVSDSDPAGVYYKPASIMILDDDPDIELSLTVDDVATNEVDEDAGTVVVKITGTLRPGMGKTIDSPVTFSLIHGAVAGRLTGTASRGSVASTSTVNDYRALETVDLVFDARATTASATITLFIVDDARDEPTETIIFTDLDGATAGGKNYTVGTVTMSIIDNDDV